MVDRMYHKDKDVLLNEHFRLQRDINDIQTQIRKLEKTNQLLDRQNGQLRKELELSGTPTTNCLLTVGSCSTTNSSGRPPSTAKATARGDNLLRKIGREFLFKKLNEASEVCEAATVEIIKHAKLVANALSNNNSKFISSSVTNNTDKGVVGGGFKTLTEDTSNRETFRMDTFRQDTITDNTNCGIENGWEYLIKNNFNNKLFVGSNGNDFESNLSSNESVLPSDDEFYNKVQHIGQYQ